MNRTLRSTGHSLEMLLARAVPDGDCLVWMGYRMRNGYGTVRVAGKRWLVHRAVWTLCNGPIPTGLVIDHGVSVGRDRGVDWSIHHRRPRQMGGSRWPGINLPSNLLLTCGSGTTGCHAHIESHRSDAITNGWLVSLHVDPAAVPCLVDHGSRWVYLTEDGTYADDPVVAA